MDKFLIVLLFVVMYCGVLALVYLFEDPDEALRDSIFSDSNIERERQDRLDRQRALKYNQETERDNNGSKK